MKTQTDITKEQQNAAAPKVQQEASTGGTATITDNRPATVYQRKLRETMNTYAASKALPVQRKTPKGSSRFQQIATAMGEQHGVDTSGLVATHNSSFPGKLNAEATIQGNKIHFAPGQDTAYNIRHEVSHAIDNTLNGTPKGDRVVNGQRIDTTREKVVDRMAKEPITQRKGKVNINDGAGLENKAEITGAKSLRVVSSAGGCQASDGSLRQSPQRIDASANMTIQTKNKKKKQSSNPRHRHPRPVVRFGPPPNPRPRPNRFFGLNLFSGLNLGFRRKIRQSAEPEQQPDQSKEDLHELDKAHMESWKEVKEFPKDVPYKLDKADMGSWESEGDPEIDYFLNMDFKAPLGKETPELVDPPVSKAAKELSPEILDSIDLFITLKNVRNIATYINNHDAIIYFRTLLTLVGRSFEHVDCMVALCQLYPGEFGKPPYVVFKSDDISIISFYDVFVRSGAPLSINIRNELRSDLRYEIEKDNAKGIKMQCRNIYDEATSLLDRNYSSVLDLVKKFC